MRTRSLLLAVGALLFAGPARAEPDLRDTRLLSDPAVSERHVGGADRVRRGEPIRR